MKWEIKGVWYDPDYNVYFIHYKWGSRPRYIKAKFYHREGSFCSVPAMNKNRDRVYGVSEIRTRAIDELDAVSKVVKFFTAASEKELSFTEAQEILGLIRPSTQKPLT